MGTDTAERNIKRRVNPSPDLEEDPAHGTDDLILPCPFCQEMVEISMKKKRLGTYLTNCRSCDQRFKFMLYLELGSHKIKNRILK